MIRTLYAVCNPSPDRIVYVVAETRETAEHFASEMTRRVGWHYSVRSIKCLSNPDEADAWAYHCEGDTRELGTQPL